MCTPSTISIIHSSYLVQAHLRWSHSSWGCSCKKLDLVRFLGTSAKISKYVADIIIRNIGYIHIMLNLSNMLEFKMAALKPEILITQLIYKILAKFQRLPPCFQGPGFQRSYSLYCMMKSGVKNPRWRLTNRNTYISACTQRNCEILMVIYMFPFYMNSMKLFFILRDASKSQKSKMAAHKHRVYSFFSLD